MKNLLILFITCFGFYYFLKYRELEEKYQFELVDIESKNDLLDQKGLYRDSQGEIQEQEL